MMRMKKNCALLSANFAITILAALDYLGDETSIQMQYECTVHTWAYLLVVTRMYFDSQVNLFEYNLNSTYPRRRCAFRRYTPTRRAAFTSEMRNDERIRRRY